MERAAPRGGLLASAALAAGLAAVAFVGKGGSELSRLTSVEIWLILGGAAAAAVGVLFARRVHGLSALAAFALLAVFVALSVSWSIVPERSWIEANRTLAYLFAFAGALALGGLRREATQTVLRGLLTAAAAVVAYALASRVWPGSLAELEIYARIGQPFGYWNAVGATAALALPLAVWLGARREGAPATAALAYPLTTLLIVALFLTYSRSALLAALIAIALWLAIVPLRLRSLAVLGIGALGAVPVLAWSLSQPAFTEDGVDLSVREAAAGEFGLFLLASIAVLYLAGYAVRTRVRVPQAARARAGRALALAAAALMLTGAGALATSERGLGGTISDRVDELTNDSAATTGGPERLRSAASSRSRYWRQARKVFADHPGAGAGAGAFGAAALRYRKDALVSRHAHGYVVQTLADLGLAGLALSLLVVIAWLVAALRAIGAVPRSRFGQRLLLGNQARVDPARAPAWTPDRIAVVALFLSALAYGLQSAIDWTWFVPGPTVMAIVAAGFVAGRGPAPARAHAAPADGDRRALAPARAGVAGAIALLALAAAWSSWQPERAERLSRSAGELAQAGEIERALAKAREAREVNPLALEPLFVEAATLQRAGRSDDALAVFEEAVREHPNDAQAWLALAEFKLAELGEPQQALATLEGALYLDPMSLAVRDTFVAARSQLRAQGLLPAPAPPAPVTPATPVPTPPPPAAP